MHQIRNDVFVMIRQQIGKETNCMIRIMCDIDDTNDDQQCDTTDDDSHANSVINISLMLITIMLLVNWFV